MSESPSALSELASAHRQFPSPGTHHAIDYRLHVLAIPHKIGVDIARTVARARKFVTVKAARRRSAGVGHARALALCWRAAVP